MKRVYSVYVYLNSETGEVVYGGLTVNEYMRDRKHASRCNSPQDPGHNLPLYRFIRANGGMDNFEMVVISRTTDRKIGLAKEKSVIETFRPVGNVHHNRKVKK